MSRNPTGTSEAGTNGSLGPHGVLLEKTGLTPLGMGMGSGLSPLGGGGGSVNGSLNGMGMVGIRDQEEERRRKMEEIVAKVGTRLGRVCQEGLERAAKRVGLECLWDEGRGGTRTLSIAGNGVLVEIEFLLEEVMGVTLEYMNSGSEVGKRAAQGAEVLKRDLTGEDDGGYVTLDSFVENLERLAKMDKLSEGGVSCFDAVEGIRSALQSVFEFEAGKTREEKGPAAAKETIDREVLSRGNGRPKMHSGGRVGLSLQYWMERSLLLPESREPEAMDTEDATAPADDEPTIYSAIIETEALHSIYPPIRISDSWLGSPIQKPTPTESDPYIDHSSTVNWQEPNPTYLPADKASGDDSMNIETQDFLQTNRNPNVRFVATLEPPIVTPLQVAADIYQSVGAPLTQESFQPTTYESLLFADTTVLPGQRTLTKRIVSYDTSGTPAEHNHQYTLFSHQPDYGRIIDSIPFSHPRQISAVLPLLRQWALTNSILRRSFTPDSYSQPKEDNSRKVANGTTNNGLDLDAIVRTQEMTVEEELAALLDEPSTPPEENDDGSKALAVDITLSTTSSAPQIGVMWPHGKELKNVEFAVGINGVIEVSGEDGDDQATERTQKVLSIAEDIGVLVEWLGSR